ncbi:MAG TPA: membrane dipeptidase [Jatrophihabitans sp.]|jgi:membrane dipeptidase|nr:membrane dipeptidase [Jatrophihabitans sp.]
MHGDIAGDFPVVDTHNDLLMAVAARAPARWSAFFRMRWLPQLRSGGVDVQVLPVWVDAATRPETALRDTLRMIECAHRIATGDSDDVALCLDGAAVRATVASGRIALVLAIEGCGAFGEDVELIETMHRLGVRVMSLAHFGRTALADGSAEDSAGSRLTRAGVAAVELMDRLGVLLDISHLGAAGVEHVLEISRRPVIATHSNARALCDHHRNLTDDQLRAIAAGGGVVCVNVVASYVHPADHTLDRLLDQFCHVIAVAGTDHVGVGPDFMFELDDELTPPWARHGRDNQGVDMDAYLPGLTHPAGLPLITKGLLGRGLDHADVAKIMGGNVLRLFDVELGRPRAVG